jgi:chromosome segregation ATPase
VSFASDGRIVSCGRDRVVKTWNPDGSPLRGFEPFTDIALKAVFDHDGSRIIAGDWTGEIRVWNVADGKRLGSLDPNPPPLAERIDVATQRIAPLQAIGDKAAADLAAAREGQAKAQQSLRAAQTALDTARHAVDDGRARVSTMDAGEHSTNDALIAARAAVQAKETELNRLNESQQQTTAARDIAYHEADDAHQAIAQCQQAVDAATKALADATAAAAKIPATTQPTTNPTAADATTQPSTTAVTTAQAALDKANAQIAQARQTETDRTNQLRQIAGAVTRAQADVVRSTAALADARKVVADEDRAHTDAVSQLQTARQTLSKAQVDGASAEKQITPQQEQLKNADQRVAQASVAAEAANAQLAAARSELSHLKAGQFFVTVYAARKELNDRQKQQEQMSQAFSSAQAAVDKASGDLIAAQKAVADAPARIAARQDAINKAKDAQSAANANVVAAKSMVEQKESLQRDAAVITQRIHDEAAKMPDDKTLADAATKSAATLDALGADVAAANQLVQQKIADAKAAVDRVGAAEADLAREQTDIANAPKAIDSLKAALAAAQGDIPAKKSALDEANQACDTVKARVDQLEGDYHKMVQEAGIAPNILPAGKS